MKTIAAAHVVWVVLRAVILISLTGCSIVEDAYSELVNPSSSPQASVSPLPDVKPRKDTAVRSRIKPTTDQPDSSQSAPARTVDSDEVAFAVSMKLAGPLGKLDASIDRNTEASEKILAALNSQTERLDSMEARSKLAMKKIDGIAEIPSDDCPVLKAIQAMSEKLDGLMNQKQTVKSPPSPKVLWMFCKAHCEPCRECEESLAKYGWFDLIVDHDEANHPDWVKRKGMNGYPIIEWVNTTGVHTYTGWRGLKAFIDYYNSQSGKKAASSASSAQAVPSPSSLAAFYPVRGNWWTGCGSWRHLTQGEHAGKFDPAWLQSLSYSEIQSLHSDDHDGRVKWQYVQRPGQYRTMACKQSIPVKLVGYQPSPPVPAPNGDVTPPTPPAPPEPLKMRDANGTEWQEAPPTIISKQFYSVSPPAMAAPVVVGGWGNWKPWKLFSSGPVASAPVYTSSSYGYAGAVSTRKAARINNKIAKLQAKLNNHAARVAGRVTYESRSFMYLNTAPRVRVRSRPFYRSYRLGICPTC